MPDLSHPPSADGVRELPDEIVNAIQYFEMAAKEWGDAQGDPPTGHILKACRSALTAAILSRLGEAEAGREEARTQSARLLSKLEEHRERLFEPWDAKKAIWPDHPAQYRFGDGGTLTIHFTNKEVREILSALTEAGRLALKEA